MAYRWVSNKSLQSQAKGFFVDTEDRILYWPSGRTGYIIDYPVAVMVSQPSTIDKYSIVLLPILIVVSYFLSDAIYPNFWMLFEPLAFLLTVLSILTIPTVILLGFVTGSIRESFLLEIHKFESVKEKRPKVLYVADDLEKYLRKSKSAIWAIILIGLIIFFLSGMFAEKIGDIIFYCFMGFVFIGFGAFGLYVRSRTVEASSQKFLHSGIENNETKTEINDADVIESEAPENGTAKNKKSRQIDSATSVTAHITLAICLPIVGVIVFLPLMIYFDIGEWIIWALAVPLFFTYDKLHYWVAKFFDKDVK